MMQLIALFEKAQYEIHFASTAKSTGFEENLTTRKIKTHTIQVNDSAYDEFVAQMNPDLVMYDRFMTEEQFGWRVRKEVPDALTVLDSEDLHFLRKGRQTAVKKKGFFETQDYYNDTTKRELASIMRTDLTLIISSFEMSLLTETFQIPEAKLFYLPILKEKAEHIVPFEEREDLVFIGNFMHEPNWDAVLQLKKLWKHWTKKPKGMSLRIYGAYPPQKAYGLNSEREQFFVMGRADSAQEVIANARLMLAPLRFGAGLKGKLIEAMRFGTPSITTQVGAEGLANAEKWGGVVEDDLEAWSVAVSRLFEDQQQWEEAQQRGFENLESLTTDVQDLTQKVQELSSNLTAHRHQNFLGEVMHHHTLMSSEYLSRWIEEKNKKS
jgi:glycosyltransferase involved in cell wall biosynthesis